MSSPGSGCLYVLLISVFSSVYPVHGENDFTTRLHTDAHNAANQVVKLVKLHNSVLNKSGSDPLNLLKSLSGSYRPGFFFEDYMEHAKKVLSESLELTTSSGTNVSAICMNHTQLFLQQLQNRSMWTFKMIDAMGKPASDILGFNTLWLGSYDECVAVQAEDPTGPDPHPYKGRYCKATFTISQMQSMDDLGGQGFGLTVGLCVPNSCSSEDILIFVEEGILYLPINKSLIPTPVVTCQLESLEFDTRAIVAMSDLLWNVSAGWLQINKGVFGRTLLAFSIYTNGAKILNTNQPAGALTAVNGIRFLSMSWVILGHSYSLNFAFSDNFVDYSQKILNRFTFQAVANATFSVDSFFLLSGLLVAYLALKQMKKDSGAKNFSWGMFYFHRFWRLTPPYMLFMMFEACLMQYWSNGPLWSQIGLDINCRDYWWRNLLYINNFFPSKDMRKEAIHTAGYVEYAYNADTSVSIMTVRVSLQDKGNRRIRKKNTDLRQVLSNLFTCASEAQTHGGERLADQSSLKTRCFAWSWYLANDMQFFILSPLMLIPLYYSAILGNIVCLMFLLVCFLSAGIISSTNHFAANLLAQGFDQENFNDLIYIKPYCRIGPYVIGIMTGYLLYRTDCKVRLPKIVNLLGWAISTGTALSVLYGLYVVNGNNVVNNLSTNVSAFYTAVSRTAWGASLAWVVFACATGNGGFVNTLLSWKPFVPLGRLTYCAYLVHPVVIFVYIMSHSTPMHLYDLEEIYQFLGHLSVSYGVAFVVSLSFEAPMMGLEKALLGRGKNS